MKKILITGANGQLGRCLQKATEKIDSSLFQFIFLNKNQLNIADKSSVESYFFANQFDFVINCAAYTAVDNAENDIETAFHVNADAVKYLAIETKEQGANFIHVSTDYVFDGTGGVPFTEDDKTNPISVYGKSKLKGEELAMQYNPNTIIIRTAWVYSQYGKNFLKTMLRLFNEKEEISVVNDQFGTPTNANDIAKAIVKIIQSSQRPAGIYHFTNAGETSWFEFANVIKEITKSEIKINPIPTTSYPTPAQRPNYSVLNTQKIKEVFGVETLEWRESLEGVIRSL